MNAGLKGYKMDKRDPIFEIAGEIVSIQKELATATLDAYEPEVDEIIRNGILDQPHIECILDRLLDAAFDAKCSCISRSSVGTCISSMNRPPSAMCNLIAKCGTRRA